MKIKKTYKIKKEYILNVMDIIFKNYFTEQKQTDNPFDNVFPPKNTDIQDTPDNRILIENNGELSVGFYDLKNAISYDPLSEDIEMSEQLVRFCLMHIEQNTAVKYNLIEKPSSIVFGNINYDYYNSSIKELIKNKKFPDYFYVFYNLIETNIS